MSRTGAMLNLAQRYFWSKYRKFGSALFLSFVILTIAAMTVLLTLRYAVLPDIEKYHNDITLLASRAVGMPVMIGKIEADWRGLRPHLVFTDVGFWTRRVTVRCYCGGWITSFHGRLC